MARKRRKPAQTSSPPSVPSISVHQIVSGGGYPPSPALTNKGIKEAFASTYAAPFLFLRRLFCESDLNDSLRHCRLDFRSVSRLNPDHAMMIIHSNAVPGFWMTVRPHDDGEYIIHIYPYRSIAPMDKKQIIIEKDTLISVMSDCLAAGEGHKTALSTAPFL